MLSPELARTRSKVALAHRRNDPTEIEQARRDHAAEKIAECIRRTVESAPPLTAEQRDRLVRLLRSGDAA